MPASHKFHEFQPEFVGSDYCKCGLHFLNEDHGSVPAEVSQLMKRFEALLSNVGSFALCKGCLKPIYWVRHNDTRNVCYNPDASNHIESCQSSETFKRKV